MLRITRVVVIAVAVLSCLSCGSSPAPDKRSDPSAGKAAATRRFLLPEKVLYEIHDGVGPMGAINGYVYAVNSSETKQDEYWLIMRPAAKSKNMDRLDVPFTLVKSKTSVADLGKFVEHVRTNWQKGSVYVKVSAQSADWAEVKKAYADRPQDQADGGTVGVYLPGKPFGGLQFIGIADQDVPEVSLLSESLLDSSAEELSVKRVGKAELLEALFGGSSFPTGWVGVKATARFDKTMP